MAMPEVHWHQLDRRSAALTAHQPIALPEPVLRSLGELREPRQRADSRSAQLVLWFLPNRLRRCCGTDWAPRPGLPLSVADSDGGPGDRGGDVQSCGSCTG